MNVKISVIIPFFNAEKYLDECLNSILKQTFKCFEVILVNDGSTDSSVEIVNKYKNDDRIKLIEKKHTNAGDARNAGMREAKGEYLYFLDADDFVNNQLFEIIYKFAKKNELDVAVFGSEWIDDKTKIRKTIPYSVKENLIVKPIFNIDDVKDDILRIFVGWPWDKIYKRSFINDCEITFQSLHHSNDTYFVLMSLCCAKRISYLNKIMVTHRTNNESSLEYNREENFDCFGKALTKLKNDLEQKDILNKIKRVYDNYSLEFSLWHIMTARKSYDDFLSLKKYVHDFIISEGYCYNKPRYFYNNIDYIRMKQVLSEIYLNDDYFELGHIGRETYSLFNFLKYLLLSKISFGKKKNHYSKKYLNQKIRKLLLSECDC